MAESSNLKPIQTKYKGYYFRSRLEARWAVFFEEMGLDWSYEVEGYHLPNGEKYLPDFFVKSPDKCYEYFYEVKPKGTSPCPKVKQFRNLLNIPLYYEPDDAPAIFGGTPVYAENYKFKGILQLNGDPVDVVKSVCPRCKKISETEDIKYEGRFLYMCEYCDDTKEQWGEFTEDNAIDFNGRKYDLEWHKGQMELDGNKDFWLSYYCFTIEHAKLCARQARFDGSDSQ